MADATENWFTKDEAITKETEDAFNHMDLAQQLQQKILELGAPLTLALSGPHGSGKSSIGTLLAIQLEHRREYTFIRIEAWRHAGDSRRRAMLRDILDRLDEVLKKSKPDLKALDDLKAELYTTRAHQAAVVDFDRLATAMRQFLAESSKPAARWAMGTALTTIIFLTAIYFYLTNVAPAIAWSALIANLPLAFSTATTAYIAVLARQWVGTMTEPPKLTVTTQAPASSEQFEAIFKKAVSLNRSALPGKHTLVIFVDELDRLSHNEIIEALNTIRTFREAAECVFVIALDETVVRAALKTASGPVRDQDAAEEFLNKFFKVRQRIPVLLDREMREFAQTIIADPEHQRIRAGIAQLQTDLRNDILDALIHPTVKTPRHVIRLLNAFNSDYRLAKLRESGENALLSDGAITGNLPFLAVMTVIKEDEPEFFQTLAQNVQLMRAIDLLLQPGSASDARSRVEDELPGYYELLRVYFEPVKESDSELDPAAPTIAYRHLIPYLLETAQFRPRSILPYLYLREDVAGRVLGSELSEAMAIDFESYYVQKLISRLDTGTQSLATAAAQVALRCLETSKRHRLTNVVKTTCEVFERLPATYKKPIAGLIARHVAHNETHSRGLAAGPLLGVLAHAEYQVDRLSAIRKVIRRLDVEDLDIAYDVINSLIDFPWLLNSEQIEQIAEFVSKVANEAPASDLVRWIGLVNLKGVDGPLVPVWFGSRVFLSFAKTSAGIPSDELDDAFVVTLRQSFECIQAEALAKWGEAYIEAATILTGSDSWAVHMVALNLLFSSRQNIDENSARNVIKCITSGNIWESEDDKLHGTTLQLVTYAAEKYGESALPTDLGQLDTYLGRIINSDGGIGDLARGVYGKSMQLAKTDILPKTTTALCEVTVSGQGALGSVALDTLLNVAEFVEDSTLRSLCEKLAAPVIALQNGALSEFGAEALCRVIHTAGASQFAIAQVTLMLPRFKNSAPEQLELIARVMDTACSLLGADLPAYITRLQNYISGGGTANHVEFALNRLRILSEKTDIPTTLQASLAEIVVSRWSVLNLKTQKILASSLLEQFYDAMSLDTRHLFLAQQTDFMMDEPAIAARNLALGWSVLPESSQVAAITAACKLEIRRDTLLSELQKRRLEYDTTQLATLIVRLGALLSQDNLGRFVDCFAGHMSDPDKHMLSKAIFHSLRTEPGVWNERLVSISCKLQGKLSDEGILFFKELLVSGTSERRIALTWLPLFLGTNELAPKFALEFSGILSSCILTDDPDLVILNLQLVKTAVVLDIAEYRNAIKLRVEQLKGNQGNSEKELAKQLRAFQRIRGRR